MARFHFNSFQRYKSTKNDVILSIFSIKKIFNKWVDKNWTLCTKQCNFMSSSERVIMFLCVFIFESAWLLTWDAPRHSTCYVFFASARDVVCVVVWRMHSRARRSTRHIVMLTLRAQPSAYRTALAGGDTRAVAEFTCGVRSVCVSAV